MTEELEAGAVAVDPINNVVRRYGVRGVGRNLGDFGQKKFLPASLHRAPKGYLLELADGTLLLLDEELAVRERLGPMINERTGRGITSLYDYTIAGKYLVGFGTLAAPSTARGYTSAFFRARLDALNRPEILIEADDGEFFLYNQPYFAAVGEIAYFVRFSDEGARLYRVGPKGAAEELVGGIPPDYRSSPVITTRNDGPGSAPAIYAEIEASTIVAGLFSVEGKLFVLGRRPATKGHTLWSLFQVTTGEDGERSAGLPLILPTVAPHLSLAQSGDKIFLFERGRVVGMGSQDIRSFEVFDKHWVTNPATSPLRIDRMAQEPVKCGRGT